MRTAMPVARLFPLLYLILAFVLPAPMVMGASDVGLKVDEITDNRVTKGPYVGGLEIAVKLDGEIDDVDSARVIVTRAADDKGNDLLMKDADLPDFSSRNTNMGQMTVRLENPARTATSVNMSGTIEMFIPSQDPNAVVSIKNALAKLDTLLKSKTFDAEGMKIEIISPATHEKKQSTVLTEDDIAEIRRRGKKEGVSDEEIEEAIEFAKAMKEMGSETSENSVILSGPDADIKRLLRVRLLKADGSEVSIPSRSWSRSGDETIMVLDASEAPPADATLEMTVLTKKATVSVPFDVEGIELP